MKVLPFFVVAKLADSMQLTTENWDSETAGKTVLVKFQDPELSECKKMKPDWDTLMLLNGLEESNSALIADVDCTTDGRDLCTKHNVRVYPTIKHGDPDDLKDYTGGWDLAAFKQFAKENLGPSCGLENLGLCDKESTEHIKLFQSMSDGELAKAIQTADLENKELHKSQQKTLRKLQAKISDLHKELEVATNRKEASVARVTKMTGLNMMRVAYAGLKKKKRAQKKKRGNTKNVVEGRRQEPSKQHEDLALNSVMDAPSANLASKFEDKHAALEAGPDELEVLLQELAFDQHK